MFDPYPPPHPPPPPLFDQWMRHMAAVPKGFLRYLVLKLLSERPMSGSEIASEIKRRTDGRWKPSSGSLYPLLGWLQDKGYTEEVSEQEAGIKRYTLTDQGKAFLREYGKRKEKIRRKFGFLMPPFPGFSGFDFHPREAHELIEAIENLRIAGWNLLDNLREKYSEESVTEAKEIVVKATERLNEIERKLRETDK